ncbi:MAG: phenylalanine-4-hydroxylase [Oceanicoccus sp.]|jgi:phenylalanine-4-hydroxylase
MKLDTQQDTIDSLPTHLQPFVAIQHYDLYTPRDQAVWRFLLHQLKDNLGLSAHPVYLDGLARTGINFEWIPRIEEMNRCLTVLGWRAVVVNGFLPPAIFMEFQAHRILVIAVDIRSVEHMLYTPAPDIIHESAGHAPFIIDIDYSEFLQRIGELGMQAISTIDDMKVYDAIRELSILKEVSDSKVEELATAEQVLATAIAGHKSISESALLARFHWWTVEYGLVGEVDDYQIFGAGLLSSLGESVDCLDDKKVKKLPLTVDAILTPYDITSQQSQLFVTKSCRHLTQVLEEFARKMCVNTGGTVSLEKAITAGTVNTVVLSSGIEISGKFSRIIKDAVDNTVYFNTSGPSQLSYRGAQLPGQGVSCHSSGFGSPIGGLKTLDRCLSNYTIDELKLYGVEIGKNLRLEFLSGITVCGKLNSILRRAHKNLVFSIQDCTVVDLSGNDLFRPEWGVYDMAVGDDVISVYGGSADKENFNIYEEPSKQQVNKNTDDQAEEKLFEWYKQVRDFRQGLPMEPQCSLDVSTSNSLQALLNDILYGAKQEWLLLFESLELAQMTLLEIDDFVNQLELLMSDGDEQVKCLIGYGLDRLGLTKSGSVERASGP